MLDRAAELAFISRNKPVTPLNDAQLGGYFFARILGGRGEVVKFTKPAIDLAAQLQKLESRGLTVTDGADALRLLEMIGYYRFAGYAFPFLEPPARSTFKVGTTLPQIVRMYEFDRELRLLVSDAIERIEVSIRSRIVNAACMRHGSHWFLDATLFHRRFNHGRFLAKVESEVGVRYDAVSRQRLLPVTHSETFIEHYYSKYGDPYLPPFWMTAEVLTLGSLSKLFQGIGDSVLKRDIAAPFRVPTKILENWLHALAHFRNVCAHHGRLWNRQFSITPRMVRSHAGMIHSPRRFEGMAAVLLVVLDVADSTNAWRTQFKQLLKRFPEVDPTAMGFRAGWDRSSLWRS